jgi:hypothetical protein
MADSLYLSYWLKNHSALSMLRPFGKLLEKFPYSPQNPANSHFRIEAISSTEPPLLERALPDPLDPQLVLELAQEFHHADCAYVLDTWWGLWQFQSKDWHLLPARVSISCYGPDFADPPLDGAHLRIDFGLDCQFLPHPDDPASAYYTRSNLKGLLRLVHTLDEVLTVERRALWSESGENFAEKLERSLQEL